MGVFTVALLIGFMTLGTSVSLSDPLSPPPWRNGHVTSTLPTSQGSAIIQSLQCPLPLSIGQPEGRLSLIPFPMLCPRAFSLFSPSSSRRDISEPLPTSPCQLLLPTPSLVRRGWRCQFVLMVLRVSGRDSVTPTGRCKNRLSPTAAPPRHSGSFCGPGAPVQGWGWRHSTTHLCGEKGMHPAEMPHTVAGGQWHRARLVREVALRCRVLEDGLGVEVQQQHSQGLKSPLGGAHQVGGVN